MDQLPHMEAKRELRERRMQGELTSEHLYDLALLAFDEDTADKMVAEFELSKARSHDR